MNVCKFGLTISLILGFAFAHSDFQVIKHYGNITTRIETGFNYEEINHVSILGQLAEGLAKKLQYSDPIFLDFHHHYTNECVPGRFISFDKGEITHTWWTTEKAQPILTKKAIIIRQVARHFDAISTLQLIEYSIHNLKEIQSAQERIEYNKNYCQWKINTIDTTFIKTILKDSLSPKIRECINQKVYVSGKNFKHGISYYWKNNEYIFFYRNYDKPDKELLSLKSIYYIEKLDWSSVMVFDSDSSFIFLTNKHTSKKHVIEETMDTFKPYNINKIGGGKFSISFNYYDLTSAADQESPKIELIERTLLYLEHSDELIQDLDKLLDKEGPN